MYIGLNNNVLFVTSPPLLDNGLELIMRGKNITNLHVVIYSSGQDFNGTVLKFSESFSQFGFFTYSEVKKYLSHLHILDEYFSCCKSVHFAFFPKKFSFVYFKTLYSLFYFKFSNKIKILHLDDFSGVILPFYIFSFSKKTILNIHDPVPHTGEYAPTRERLKSFLIKFSSHIITFSRYSYGQMNQKYHVEHKSSSLCLLPYKFYSKIYEYKKFEIGIKDDDLVILFFGRLSKYKGLSFLVDAYRNIKRHNQRIRLLIAGKSENHNYVESLQISEQDNIILLNRFITIDEMCSLFSQSSLLVCPYIEASQSGVLMTASAFGIPVLASNVGSFSEYIPLLSNSSIYENSQSGALEDNILRILNNPIIDKRTNFDFEEYDKKLYSLYKK